MTSDADDALSWEGDEDPSADKRRKQGNGIATPAPGLPNGWTPVGRDSASVERLTEDGAVVEPAEPQPLSTPMLLLVGIVGGIYLLYTVGWIIGGLNLEMSALFLVPSLMYQVAVWAAVLAPALWFTAVWLLTRRSAAWVRVLGLLAGAALLVPWPFVMTGVVGA
ncbi:hypothetical protein [Microbacterium abyssi]|uniref:hypothetical protein n=1 Tax=Microbacterium abyssi TaxID=2782166 RepID=UPI0018894ECD|nr:hypothetical protein [Microbacterium sp. A18JL241]